MDLQSMFDHMVDMTEPICQKLDPQLAAMTIFDTSGIEAWGTENNPKYANRIIKQLKAFAYFGLFSITHASMPEVSKIVMSARAGFSFWQIGSVRSTR